MTPLTDPPRYVCPAAAAKYLGISAGTLRNRTAPRGPIPASRLGRRLLYDLQEVDAAIAKLRLPDSGEGEAAQ